MIIIQNQTIRNHIVEIQFEFIFVQIIIRNSHMYGFYIENRF